MLPALFLLAITLRAAEPIALHPVNPHVFNFRGKPTILVGSTEHYGAVLNLDFDSAPYLDELQRSGLNLTRLFSGTYREVPGTFNIRDNTLAPKPGRFLCPWARAGERFDLQHWDDAYFERLRSFLAEASARGVVVELSLFCPLYEDALWNVNPMNARNNVNGVGNCPRTEVFTKTHADLLAVQEALVRKIVSELKDFDNLFYEICNEPYFGGVTLDWQAHIAATIADAENERSHRHLIAQNIANGKARVENPDPHVSILNFHYASPPDTVGLNYGLGRPIGDDETGFRGTGDRVYRVEAWDFLLAGGTLFDNLDYSFTTDHEDGTAPVADPTPGGGGPTLRTQLKILKDFLEGFDFLHMAPDTRSIATVLPEDHPPSLRVLSEPGKAYAIYVHGGTWTEIAIDVPPGNYRAEWVEPRTGKVAKAEDLDLLHAPRAQGGVRAILRSPEYTEDIALRIVAAAVPARSRSGQALPRFRGRNPLRARLTEDLSPSLPHLAWPEARPTALTRMALAEPATPWLDPPPPFPRSAW